MKVFRCSDNGLHVRGEDQLFIDSIIYLFLTVLFYYCTTISSKKKKKNKKHVSPEK